MNDNGIVGRPFGLAEFLQFPKTRRRWAVSRLNCTERIAARQKDPPAGRRPFNCGGAVGSLGDRETSFPGENFLAARMGVEKEPGDP